MRLPVPDNLLAESPDVTDAAAFGHNINRIFVLIPLSPVSFCLSGQILFVARGGITLFQWNALKFGQIFKPVNIQNRPVGIKRLAVRGNDSNAQRRIIHGSTKIRFAFAQFFLCFFLPGDVQRKAADQGRLVLPANGKPMGDPGMRSVLLGPLRDGLHHFAPQNRFILFFGYESDLFRPDFLALFSQPLLRLHAETFFNTPRQINDAPVGILDVGAARKIPHELPEELFAVPPGVIREHPLRDIPGVANEAFNPAVAKNGRSADIQIFPGSVRGDRFIDGRCDDFTLQNLTDVLGRQLERLRRHDGP